MRKRNIQIALKIYRKDPIQVTLKTVLSHGPDLIDTWPGEILNLVIDGKEFLSVLFSQGCEEVRNAVWSSNRFLAAREHNGVSCEIGLTYLLSLVKDGTPPKSWKHLLRKIQRFYFRNTPGFRTLPYRQLQK